MDDLKDILNSGVRCKGCRGLTSKRLPACYRCGRKLDGDEPALTAAEIETLKQDMVKVQTLADAGTDAEMDRTRRALRTAARVATWASLALLLVIALLGLVRRQALWWEIVPLLGLGGAFVLRFSARRSDRR